MLNALKYIILFLLGYKIIKELFKDKQSKKVKQPTTKSKINYEEPKPAENKQFDNAEDIDFEELK